MLIDAITLDLFLATASFLSRDSLAWTLSVCREWHATLDAHAHIWGELFKRFAAGQLYVPASLTRLARGPAALEAEADEERARLAGLRVKALRLTIHDERLVIPADERASLLEKGDFVRAIVGARRRHEDAVTDRLAMLLTCPRRLVGQQWTSDGGGAGGAGGGGGVDGEPGGGGGLAISGKAAVCGWSTLAETN